MMKNGNRKKKTRPHLFYACVACNVYHNRHLFWHEHQTCCEQTEAPWVYCKVKSVADL